ncbi:DUF2752 domain-containing protein [Mycobacterium camsae]|uniref:DUF2752 domain-containing protein n=1 Tax=Mycobacterium gordonae TaxID=1778 RepID=UPI00198054E3|nr:DUF2752 domain-containing protein [Mycobacterium gordonae]
MEPDSPAPATPKVVTAGSAVLLTGALTYIGVCDPHKPDSVYPLCPFKFLTGWNCPACGGLRMTHDLLHGDLLAAATDNVFALVVIPLLAVWILVRRFGGRSWLPTPTTITLLVAAAAWTVVRNLPGFPLVPTLLTG